MRVHQTSPQEIHDLRAVVERDLTDASVEALSDDRRFATAYNAVLQLTKIVSPLKATALSGWGTIRPPFRRWKLLLGSRFYSSLLTSSGVGASVTKSIATWQTQRQELTQTC